MEIAVLVFFLAIFGGVLFLLGIIWFFVRRARNTVSERKEFSGGAGYGGGAAKAVEIDSDSDDAMLTDYWTFSSQESENQTADRAAQSDNTYSQASGAASAVPVESSYSSYESSSSYSSSYDSGSGSSYDSGSSSSDSGSSSSSSD